MSKTLKYLISGPVLLFLGAAFFQSQASLSSLHNFDNQEPDSLSEDTLSKVQAKGPQFKLRQEPEFPVGEIKQREGIQLRQPSNLKSNVTYDPVGRDYIFSAKIGKIDYRHSSDMSMKEYQKYELHRSIREYWQTQANGGKTPNQRGLSSSFNLGGEAFNQIFGSNAINIVPQGQAELIFGVNITTTNNPTIPVPLRTVPSFNFEEKIQMNVTGTIGQRLKLGINYNTEATFEFENKTKLEYTGDEDEIVKKIEAGDVNLPLPGTLITGSQSLFGIKTEMQFGKLSMTSVLSQQKGQTQVIQVQGGAQVTSFEITADQYEANKHFFLAHEFKNKFDQAHQYLPRVASNITITRIEVWITNKKNQITDARSILAFIDLGENNDTFLTNKKNVKINSGTFPDNEANNLYNNVKVAVQNYKTDPNVFNKVSQNLDLSSSIDYEYLGTARKLGPNEFTFDPVLGYISLNSALNSDEVMGIAFEYKVSGSSKPHQVGQFAADNPTSTQPLVVKLIKGTNLSPHSKTWQLMMKNIYSLGAYELSNDNFYLNILYHDDQRGSDVNYLPNSNDTLSKIILLRLFDLDRMNIQQEPQPDGIFDFIDGVTIDKKNGRIIFPMIQPFGKGLKERLLKYHLASGITDKFVYQELYDSSLTKATLDAEKNKFKLKGTYKSASSSEIYLNAMNVPQGSVKVSAGGITLTEGTDYIVDYTMGTVKIINSAYMTSGQPIQVSLENNSNFNLQTKTLIGTHLDYKFNDDFNIGATILHLNERPLTQKVNIGDEPVSNTMWGLNTSYRTKSQFLTTLVDKIPFIQTKEISSIALTGEFAQLIPGSSSVIGKNGVAYIDDFEGSETTYDYRSPYSWVLASTPTSNFPEGTRINDLSYGYNRAKLSWFTIDQSLQIMGSTTPDKIRKDTKSRSSHYVRLPLEQEIFPKRESQYNLPNYLQVLNLTYYPNLRGPYNFVTSATDDPNGGLDANGQLNHAENRWGGIMHKIESSDFEAANVEYIEFWLMDPYVEDSTNSGGQLYFDLGNISEDILKDSKMAFEQGMPVQNETPQYDTTVWGRVSTKPMVSQNFNSQTPSIQDIGLDGLSDKDEKSFYTNFINKYKNVVTDTGAIDTVSNIDPSGDDFRYFSDPYYDNNNVGIIDRYKDWNGMEGNSSTSVKNNSIMPDMEDINQDYTSNLDESYFEYKVDLSSNPSKPSELIKSKYIVDVRTTPLIEFPDHTKSSVKWYQFKVPISDYIQAYNGIEDFKSIRFMRMYLTGFKKRTILRFGALQLVRGEWRQYENALIEGSESTTEQPTNAALDIQAVNIEENSERQPINYVLPPGISRVIDPSQPQLRQLNEQSMVLKVTDLADGTALAAFKTGQIDMRQYQRLQMFAHCEQIPGTKLGDHEVSVFIRLGTDYKENYYEYEVPMKVSVPYNGGVMPDTSVWPPENNFDILLSQFQKLKLDRDNAKVPLQNLFQEFDGKTKNKMTVCGSPTLSAVKTIMIGVRNPGDRNNPYHNDHLAKSAEIWVDELRLTDFSDQGGWAANARAQIKLADLGTLRVSGSTMSPGFGSIEKKVNDREKAQTEQFDIATELELGKFFPDKAQVRIPFHASYSETVVLPQYNPYDPDIKLQVALDNATSQKEKTKIQTDAEDFLQRRSLNLTNVKINKTSKKPKFYDPSNFSVSLAYNDMYSHNPTLESDQLYHSEVGFNYLFNNRPLNVTPFRKIKFLNNKMLRLFQDFNFNYSPTSIAFRTNLVYNFQRMKYRNITNDTTLGLQTNIPPTIDENFKLNRIYDVKYDLSRSIKIDFSANSVSILQVGDPNNPNSQNITDYQKKKELILNELLRGGQTRDYNQQLSVNYTVPVNKLPLLDWVNLTTRYTGSYEWTYQPLFTTTDNQNNLITHNLGNTIKNSRNIQLNSSANLTSIYNHVKFLKDLQAKGKGKEKEKPKKTVTFEKTYFTMKAGVPKSISHKLGTEDVTVTVKDADGKEVKGKMEVISGNRVTFTPESDVTNATVNVQGKVDAGQDILLILARGTARILTGIKSVSGSYSITEGTTLPGYTTQPPNNYGNSNEAQYFGSTFADGQVAPGIPFILGFQDTGIIRKMHKMGNSGIGWLATDPLFNSPVLMTSMKTLNLRLSYEPFDGLKVELTANRSYTENNSINYNTTNDTFFVSPKPTTIGNFSMTVISFKSFEKLSSDSNYKSKYFIKFLNNRETIRLRLDSATAQNPNYPGYRQNVKNNGEGFSKNSQQVLIPTFLSTYGGYGTKKVPIDLIPSTKFMLPNWRITYDGLSNLPFIKEYFRSITLSHSYTSTYNIGAFASNLNDSTSRDPKYSNDKFNYSRDVLGNYVPEFDVTSVSINEQFSPFIGIDMNWKNNLNTRFDFKKSRTVSLSLSNDAITETRNLEYVFGVGYRFPDVPLKFISMNGGQSTVKSDLNVHVDFSIRDDYTLIESIEDAQAQTTDLTPSTTAGNMNEKISVTADYALSDRLNVRLFYERALSDPHVGSYKTINTNIGFSVKFTLAK